MVLLVEKLGRSLKFPSTPADRRLKSDALANFRAKISVFIAGILLPPPQSETKSKLLSLKGFSNCFELIHTSNTALAELATAIDLPMHRWGSNLADEYLRCTADFLSLSNAVAASISDLTLARMRLLHAVGDNRRRCSIAAAPQEVKFERRLIKFGERSDSSSRKEELLLRALILCRRLGLLALGVVVAGLCGDAAIYAAVRRSAGDLEEDLLVKEMDSKFYRELVWGGVMEEVREVNMAVESVDEVKRRLKVMEDSLHGIEKQSDHLFSQLLAARNKLLANIRFPE